MELLKPLEIVEKGIKYLLNELGVYTPADDNGDLFMLDETSMTVKPFKDLATELGIQIEHRMSEIIPGMNPLGARWCRSERSIILPTPPPAGDTFGVNLLVSDAVPEGQWAMMTIPELEPATLSLEDIKRAVRMLGGISQHQLGIAMDIPARMEPGFAVYEEQGMGVYNRPGLQFLEVSLVSLPDNLDKYNLTAPEKSQDIIDWEERWHRRGK